MSWTPERTEQLKQLNAQGLSATQIARKMGNVSRGAVIGKLSRLGLVLDRARARPPADPARITLSASAARDGSGQIKGRPRKIQPTRIADARLRPAPVSAAPEPAPVTKAGPYRLEDRPEGGCRYPVNDPPKGGNFLFCGDAAQEGSSYCARHHKLCRVPAPKPPARQPRQGAKRMVW